MAKIGKISRAKRSPGTESQVSAISESSMDNYLSAGKLKGKVALITGGDSGIGRAVAIAYAKEGARVVINYLSEEKDATETKRLVQAANGDCMTIAGDISNEKFCNKLIAKVIKHYGKIDVLVNNAGEQQPQDSIELISAEQLERTFRTNVFSMFYLIKAALPHMPKGGSIINTASVVAFKGNPLLLDYSATKGAIIGLTRSLAISLAKKNIRVNAVAPGPIWTPLIPSTFDKKKLQTFGKDTPMQRAGQPDEVAPAFVFCASDDATYITGQTIHVNGGLIVNA